MGGHAAVDLSKLSALRQGETILSSGMCTNRRIRVRQSCGSKLQLTAKDATTVASTVSGRYLIYRWVFSCIVYAEIC